MSRAVTPRSIVLNLLRVTTGAVSVKRLLAVGELFGMRGNAMRVALARLVAEGRVESDERGSYRLAPAAAPVSEHVEEWRRGESRLRPWRSEWLAVALPAGAERATRRGSLAALERLGLREGLAGLWVRPDNLRQTFESTQQRLLALGLEDGAELFRARDFGVRTARRFATELWPVRNLERGYSAALRNLERSLTQLPGMPRETALVQTYLLGGEAIRVLATDPLLPEEIMASETRAALTQAMLRYDAVGHALWRDFRTEPELRALDGGRLAG
jgi:phenylacetic acid degradation operon negative regulatory protein